MQHLLDRPVSDGVDLGLVLAGLGIADEVAEVRSTHGRALCFQVTLGGGQELFVKAARPGGEAAILAEAGIVATLTGLGVRVPALLGRDRTTGTAVYESVAHGTPLTEVSRDLQPEQAARLGRMAAEVHAQHRRADLPLPATGSLGRASTDWLTLTPRTLSTYPPAHRELWAKLGAEGRDALFGLAEAWRSDRLIHADIKDDNIFLADGTGSGALLIDWETAGWGDPRWDLGSLLGGFILTWLYGMDLASGTDLDTWIASAATPLEHVAALCRAAVTGYRDLGDLTEEDLVSTLGYAGAFLAHRGLSVAMQASRLPGHAQLSVHLARQFLLRPRDVKEMLL